MVRERERQREGGEERKKKRMRQREGGEERKKKRMRPALCVLACYAQSLHPSRPLSLQPPRLESLYCTLAGPALQCALVTSHPGSSAEHFTESYWVCSVIPYAVLYLSAAVQTVWATLWCTVFVPETYCWICRSLLVRSCFTALCRTVFCCVFSSSGIPLWEPSCELRNHQLFRC